MNQSEDYCRGLSDALELVRGMGRCACCENDMECPPECTLAEDTPNGAEELEQRRWPAKAIKNLLDKSRSSKEARGK